ncbi:Heterokaryon incompatibility protein 6- OR allele [Apiospora arundinis]
MSTGVSYRPIAADEFRVVHLLPASPEDNDNGEDDEVWCLLETRSSSLKTQYEALSYQWGDETVTRPIHIAHLSLPSATTSTRPGTQEEGTDRTGITARIAAAAVVYMVAPCQQSLSQAAKRIIPRPVRLGAAAVARRLNLWHCLRALAWLAVTAASWSFLSPPLFMDGATVTLDQQQRRRQLHVSWDKVYLLVVCMINGAGVVSMTIKTFQLLAEVWRTKPWLLGSRVRIGHDIVAHFHRFRKDRKRQGGGVGGSDMQDADDDDDTIGKSHTLWQPASGDGEGNKPKRKRGGGPRHGCQHEQQIQAAFKFIKSMSGMRLLYAALFMPRRDRHAQLQTARPGLLDITRRGWWERLWVLQEVALATGPVQIQCGRTTCEFGKFVTGHLRILEDLGEDKNNMYGDSDNNNNNSNKALIKALGPSRRLLDAVRDFRYSYLKEREGPLFKTAYGWMSQGLRRLMGDTSKKRTANFHEQPFADRLQRVLLRTAGRFRCRDGRDRLDFNSSVAVVQSMQYFVPAESASASGWFGATCAALVGAHLVWDAFYTADAKHWTISRPEYVVTKNKKFSNTFADASERQTPAEFFTTLARFLAQETQSLAFLDASPCGKPASGSREDIPSWVPDWAREVDHAAYENATRAREDDEARDIFQFIDEGKTLELVGRPWAR